MGGGEGGRGERREESANDVLQGHSSKLIIRKEVNILA